MYYYHQNPAIYVSNISLRVMNIEKSIDFYNYVFGFEVIEKGLDYVLLGFKNRGFLRLVKATKEKSYEAAGLYHVAFLVPNRSDLANWLYYHFVNSGDIFSGASNHAVSEAIYLEDLDGNGIEVYSDTNPKFWEWNNNKVQMVTERLNLDNLFNDITIPTNKLPNNTIIGHIHLSVINVEKSETFYNLLGFETVFKMPHAAFLSSKKYHHHIGINSWNTKDGKNHDDESADLDYFVIAYPSVEVLDEALNNLKANGYTYQQNIEEYMVRDLNNIKVILKLGK